MSFIKHRDSNQSGERGKVFWERADTDGAPFRGPFAPMLKEEEFEEYAQRTHDATVRVFDLANEEHLKAYQEVIDGASNNVYKVIRDETKYCEQTGNWKVLCVWLETYMELPSKILRTLGNAQSSEMPRS